MFPITQNGSSMARKSAAFPLIAGALVFIVGTLMVGCFGTELGEKNTAPNITTHPQSTTVMEGESAEFFVVATGTDLIYRWIMDDTDIPDASSDTLILEDVTLDMDGALIQVEVSNSAGTVLSNSATLSVTPPSLGILRHPGDTIVEADGTAEFTVAATGTNLTYKWVKNNSDTISGANAATLTIDNVAYEDYGTYKAIVSDEDSTVVSNAGALLVEGPNSQRAALIYIGGEGLNNTSAMNNGVFYQNCAGCHNNGIGFPGGAPPLANSDHVMNNREHIIEVLLRGGFADSNGFTVNGVPYAEGGGGSMPSFSWFSDLEIAATLTYIRAVLNDSLVTSCEPYDPNDPETYDENGFAFCTKVARDSADIAADSIAVWEVTAMRDSLDAEGLLD